MGVPKKILYVITKANWGGAQRYVFDLAVATKAAGFEPTVAYGVSGELVTRLETAGITTAQLANMGRNIKILDEFRSFWSLFGMLRRDHPDILHVNSSKAGGLGALAGRLARIKNIVFTAHGWAFNEDRPWWHYPLVWLGHYATVLLAHRTIAVSRAGLRSAQNMPFVSRRLSLVPLGIGEPSFLPREDAREKLAERMDVAVEEMLWIGVLAELTWNKGVHHLVRAVGELKRKGIKCIVCVLGEGEERKFLETLIEEQGLGQEVRLPGFVADGRQYLRAFDIFVLSSHTEALSYALIEAGYAGLPVVATNVGGIPEVIDDHISGLLVPRENPGKLAEALSSLIESAEKRSVYGAALGESVRQRFGLSRMVEQTLALYRS